VILATGILHTRWPFGGHVMFKRIVFKDVVGG